MSSNLLFNYSISTNRGLREINEDASWVGLNGNNQCLMVICDGIGSQDDSQIASFIAVDVFRKNFTKHSKIFNIDRFFNKCLKSSYNNITDVANKKLNGRKIGTTLVVTFIDNNKVTTYNLGDSRLYHFSLINNS
jgi:protein phosphatase